MEGNRKTAYAEFFVHQSLIDPRSALVARSLKDLPSEPEDCKITITDCEPQVVSQYINPLYVCIPCAQACLSSDEVQTDKLSHKDSDTDVSTASDRYFSLCKLYILAETLVDQSTKAKVLDELYVGSRKQE